MNKKAFSALFMLGATIFNFIVTAAIVAGLFFFFSFIQFRVFHYENPNLFLGLTMFSFLAGIILGLLIYTKTLPWVIMRFDLADKLDEHLLGKYLPNGKRNPYYKAKNVKKATTTNLPKSALPKDDMDEWEREVENSNPYLSSFEVKSFGRDDLEKRAAEETQLKDDGTAGNKD